MKIVSLDKRQFKGYEIDVSYYTKANYLVTVKKSKEVHLIIKKRSFYKCQYKIPLLKIIVSKKNTFSDKNWVFLRAHYWVFLY